MARDGRTKKGPRPRRQPPPGDLNLRQLEVFARVMEHRSFSRAGKVLYLTQPTVSGHIAALEKHLGVSLFDRMGRKVSPTSAAQVLYPYASRMLADRKEALAAVHEHQGLESGRLLMGASTIPGSYILPSLLRTFKERHPGVTVSLGVADSRAIADQVHRGDWELGFVGVRPRQRDLLCTQFHEDRLILAVPPDHRLARRRQVALRDLAGQPFLLREAGSGTRRVLEEALERKGIIPERDWNLVCELGSSEAVKEGIRRGVGISILSNLALEHEIDCGLVRQVRVAGLDIRRKFFVIQHRRRSLSPAAKAFRRFIT